MAPHSSTLTWKIPWMEEPGRLQSMRSLRVRHDWATSLSLFIFLQWRRKWQPTPVFLPGESQGQGILVGGRLWGHSRYKRPGVTTFYKVHAFSVNFVTFPCKQCMKPVSGVCPWVYISFYLTHPLLWALSWPKCDYAGFLENYVLLCGSCLVQVLCEAYKVEKRSVAFPLFQEFVDGVIVESW